MPRALLRALCAPGRRADRGTREGDTRPPEAMPAVRRRARGPRPGAALAAHHDSRRHPGPRRTDPCSHPPRGRQRTPAA
ncbi:MAG: hypothetical protein M3198_10740 [Actinomycetota bacterium]|nr:hypothetical protein [Actinomycetota bacterium]